MTTGHAQERPELEPPRRRNTVSSVPSRPSSVVGHRERLTSRPVSEYAPPQGPRMSLVLPDGISGEPRMIENVASDSYANELIQETLQNYVPLQVPQEPRNRESVITIQVPERLQQQTEIIPMTFLRPKGGVHQSTYSIGSSSQVTDSGEGEILTKREPVETALTHHPYPLRRFRVRAASNIVFPIFIVAFYGYIVFAHVRQEPQNNIIPKNNAGQRSNPRTTFYTWFIICVFALDATKSGIAGLEAGAMMKKFVSPASAMQTLWHADRSWGNVSGWLRSFMVITYPVIGLVSPRFRKPHSYRLPTLLWFYLASNSLILFMAIPLSGIAIELNTVKKYTEQPANVTGASYSSFDEASLLLTAETTKNNWVKGTISRRDGVAPLYFPKMADPTSKDALILDDFLQTMSNAGPSVHAFAPPYTVDDVWGNAWGIYSRIKCDRVKFESLKYVKESAFNADTKMEMATSLQDKIKSQQKPSSLSIGPIHEISENFYEYDLDQRVGWNVSKIAEENTIDEYDARYHGPSPERIFEIGIWQNVSSSLNKTELMKINFTSLLENGSNDIVSREPHPTGMVIKFGVSCTISSELGTADISPGPRTYRNFTKKSLERRPNILNIADAMTTIESIAYKVFSLTQHRAKSISTSVGYFAQEISLKNSNTTDNQLIYPLLQPEHVQKSMYRLLGQAAVDSMGPRNYQSNGVRQKNLKQLDPDGAAVVRGRPLHKKLKFLNAEFAFGLLVVWCWMTIIPGIYFGFSPRWAATLNGFEMYKFGIESVGAPDAQRFTGEDFWQCDELASIEAQWWRKRQ